MSTGAEATGPEARGLAAELAWFDAVLDARLRLYFGQDSAVRDPREITPPVPPAESAYAALVDELGLDFDQRLVVILALIPHLRPQALDTLFIDNKALGRPYTEFGGWRGQHHSGFLPTCETAAFILAGDDLVRRFEVLALFDPEHALATSGVLRIEALSSPEPALNAPLLISGSTLARLTTGVDHKPDFGAGFPAKRLTTKLTWDDLVLAPEVMDEVDHILAWLRHEAVLMDDWGLGKRLRPGYRCLFYGPPGTGKTLTASLIGQASGRDVYRIDLSMVVSKYIGETEKNLAGVFDQARNRHWILFFDEADALFGKRTQTSNSHDRYANQEVSYLLQRVEDFPGVVILATNLKTNIDEGFARRFQAQVYFPMPDADERRRLWEVTLGGRDRLDQDVALAELAQSYPLSGGAMTNVVRYAAIAALRGGRQRIAKQDLVAGITRELRKEGKNL